MALNFILKAGVYFLLFHLLALTTGLGSMVIGVGRLSPFLLVCWSLQVAALNRETVKDNSFCFFYKKLI